MLWASLGRRSFSPSPGFGRYWPLQRSRFQSADQLCGSAFAEQLASVVGDDRLLAVAADVREVRLRAAGVARAAGHLDDDLRRPAHRPLDLFDLLGRERNRAARAASAVAHDVQAQVGGTARNATARLGIFTLPAHQVVAHDVGDLAPHGFDKRGGLVEIARQGHARRWSRFGREDLSNRAFDRARRAVRPRPLAHRAPASAAALGCGHARARASRCSSPVSCREPRSVLQLAVDRQDAIAG